MQIIDVIKSRRSIRSYTDQAISKADLQEIIECGMYAPSAHNQQAWEFFVVQDKEKQAHL
jgi:nitroreductase